jgi:hypothetical protein
MGGSSSRNRRPPPPPPPVYYYYDVDVPGNANKIIYDKNNTISNQKNVQLPNAVSQLNSTINTTVADYKTKIGLDNQVTKYTAARDKLNQKISSLTDDFTDTNSKIVVRDAILETDNAIIDANTNAISDSTNYLNNAVVESSFLKEKYYATVSKQNNLLSQTLSDTLSGFTTNDKKSANKDDHEIIYATINWYLFIIYYVFLVWLLYLYGYVQVNMHRYKKIAIIIALILYPFYSEYLVEFLYYVYRVIISFMYSIPYVPLRQ